jgi:putative MATE family efflux protein
MQTNLSKVIDAKTLTLFALPTIAMLLVESLYSLVDGLFVARFVSTNALAAINIVMPAFMFSMGIGIMFGVGGSAIVAKKMGEGKWQEAREDFSMIAIALAAASALSFIIGFAFIDEILDFLGASELIMPYARDYFWIMLIGIFAYMGQFLFQNFFIVAGEPKLGLACVIGAGLANVLLDYLFIVVFGWGISGAAWGTTLSCAIPNIIGAIYFFNPKRALHFAPPKWHFSIVWQSGVNGSSAMVNFAAIGVIAFLFNRTMIDLAGEVGVAAVTIISASEYIFNTIFVGYGTGISPVISFYYGAKKRELLARLIKISFASITALSIITLLIIALFAPQIIRLYAPGDAALYAIAIEGFHIFVFKYFFAGFGILMSVLFTAFAMGKISTLTTTLRTFGLVVPMLLLLPPYFGLKGVWMAVPVAEFVTLCVSVVFFVYVLRRVLR